MSRPTINPGTLNWSGEHWINYLREEESDKNSAMISLYHTRYSAAGEGNVAFVDLADQPDCLGVYTDSQELAKSIQSMISGRNKRFDRDLPVYKANIFRIGDIRYDPGWVIETETHRFVSSWQSMLDPLIVEGPAPTFGSDRDFFTILIFTWSASISVNGEPCKGKPYPTDIWEPSIGGTKSSCLFALAETMILIP